MCVYSMVMDHYREKWEPRNPLPLPITITTNIEPAITDEEIRELRRLLERAKKYDAEHGEPDCGLDDKKEALQKLAQQLGVEITFP